MFTLLAYSVSPKLVETIGNETFEKVSENTPLPNHKTAGS